MSLESSTDEIVYSSQVAGNVDTDVDSQTEVTFSDVRLIESVADVDVHAAGAYKADVASVDGNTATVVVYEESTDGTPTEVGEAVDVTDLHLRAFGY